MSGVLFFLVLMIIAGSFAVKDERFVDAGKIDTALVESMVREVRAAVPTNLKDLLAAGRKCYYQVVTCSAEHDMKELIRIHFLQLPLS